MRLGFILDQSTCIGCHACTVACKSEHQVPVGGFRTWVKYIEKGEFPDVKRSFAVLRCNHCDDAPCIAICPTKALFRRDNGIVDFDKDRCIGCKSCMQACPYDAIYIDPETQTAAKCNFCAHRVEQNLEPACVVVCPVQAIGVGDLDDPESKISKLARDGGQVRKPEQGTNPKTYYIGATAAAINPAIPKDKGPYAFAQQPGAPPAEPGLIREIYDVRHDMPWGWKVWSYLWTKSIASGVLLVAAALGLLHPGWAVHPLLKIATPILALVFITITAALLVFDLKRPERFLFLLIKPNFTSWLVWGGYILGIFGTVAAAWFWFGPSAGLMAFAVPTSVAAAGYTAFLFWQAKGRDFWESVLLLPHLIAQAILAGAATLIALAPAFRDVAEMLPSLRIVFDVGLAAHFALTIAEMYGTHAEIDAARAAREITAGMHARDFFRNVLTLGVAFPFVLIAFAPVAGAAGSSLGLIAALLALHGLYRYERMWIIAGQTPPLS